MGGIPTCVGAGRPGSVVVTLYIVQCRKESSLYPRIMGRDLLLGFLTPVLITVSWSENVVSNYWGHALPAFYALEYLKNCQLRPIVSTFGDVASDLVA